MRVSHFFILVLASSFLAACQQEAVQTPSGSQANIQQINTQRNVKKEAVESGKPVAESMTEVVPTERTVPEKTMVAGQKEALKTSNSIADEVVARVESKKPVEPSKEMKVMDIVKTPVKPKMATTLPAILEAEAGNPLQGVKVAKKCGACHTFDQGGKNKTGPNLAGIVGRTKGGIAKFIYGPFLQAENAVGAVWDEASLRSWLLDSKAVAKAGGSKTRMPAQKIKGAKSDDIIAYLKTL